MGRLNVWKGGMEEEIGDWELSSWEGQFGIGRFAIRMRENIGYDTF